MPTLAREPDIFPETLLESRWRAGDELSWWALYTRARCEKALARRLHAMCMPFYAPLVARRTHSPSGRVRTSFVPLFPNYVFMFGTQEQRQTAMTSNCISRWMQVHNGRQLEDDLRQIRRLITMDAPLTVEARLATGHLVRVKSGPFAGFEGTILMRRTTTRLVVCVHFLQQGVSIELEDCQLEPT